MESLDGWMTEEGGWWVKEYSVRQRSPFSGQQSPVPRGFWAVVAGIWRSSIWRALLCYDPTTRKPEYVQQAGNVRSIMVSLRTKCCLNEVM
ncbi:hypothetical protein ACJRO7_019866 [Eucalyptus globulus]|uniref:Uncharacterized protein n=1 Tax=Eucalyptus globulus TaxID=34317 RepID=A0ABD3KET2_EUCGL